VAAKLRRTPSGGAHCLGRKKTICVGGTVTTVKLESEGTSTASYEKVFVLEYAGSKLHPIRANQRFPRIRQSARPEFWDDADGHDGLSRPHFTTTRGGHPGSLINSTSKVISTSVISLLTTIGVFCRAVAKSV
jgi:hypothetical protein